MYVSSSYSWAMADIFVLKKRLKAHENPIMGNNFWNQLRLRSLFFEQQQAYLF